MEDNLIGGPGNDGLTGGSSGDILLGNEDTDTLHGGEGDDYLAGGPRDGDACHGEGSSQDQTLGIGHECETATGIL